MPSLALSLAMEHVTSVSDLSVKCLVVNQSICTRAYW